MAYTCGVASSLLIFASLVLMACSLATADDGANQLLGEYDLQRCVDTALAKNPSLRAAAARISEARADLKQARGSRHPRLTATAGITVFQEDPSFVMPGFGRLVYGQRSNYDAALLLEYPLFTGGRYDAWRDQAKAGIRAAVFREARTRQTVALEAVSAYFCVLLAERALSVARAQEEALAAQNQAVAKMYEVGLAPRLDSLRTATALASANEGVVIAENARQVAIAALKAVLGLPLETTITVVDRYEEVQLPAEVEEAVSEALEQRPDLRQLKAQIEAAESARRLAHNQQQPTLGLFGRADFLRSSALPRTGALSGGLGIRWPIFDGEESDSNERRAEAQCEELKAHLDGLKDQVTLQVTEAFLSLKAAEQRVQTTQRAVEAAEEGFELAAVGYANQVVPLTDMLDAQARRTQVQNDNVTAIHDRRTAMARLVYALGR